MMYARTVVAKEPWQLSACDAVSALRQGTLTPLDLVDVAAARVLETDGVINALPEKLRGFDKARAEARSMMGARQQGKSGACTHEPALAIRQLANPMHCKQAQFKS